MPFTMQPVKSSQIAAVGYDAAAKKLAVQFTRGQTYHYDNVPPELHQQLLGAESIGSFFGKTIRSNPDAYPHVKIEQEGGNGIGE